MTLRVGIITVSDSCSRGEREDKSGAVLKEIVERGGWQAAATAVVPDDALGLQRVLREWCDRRLLDVVLTTGGTGVGPRDVTPEATRAVLDKELPGLAEHMRREGMAHTPMSLLSRGVAGVRGRSVIVNLPGSPGGAEQSFKIVAGFLPHAVEILGGAGHGPPPVRKVRRGGRR